MREPELNIYNIPQIGFGHLPKDIQAKLKQRKAEAEPINAPAIEEEL